LPRLTPVHWKTLECIFLKAGFKFERQVGSHRSYAKPGVPRPIIIPVYDEVPVFIIMNNLRSARLSRDKYFELLGECR
jgi:predicted RNA binding protein YcfA (HicA-like mRNA interferase family)